MYDCFFFKQKTAYELRISDWSSDVCSSDLECVVYRQTEVFGFARFWGARRQKLVISHAHARGGFRLHLRCDSFVGLVTWEMRDGAEEAWSEQRRSVPQPTRSEEHTSELQSLMRISYAVFCLKKKKINTTHTNT